MPGGMRAEQAAAGEVTYVHCKAGRGRSTTLVICYLVRELGMSPQEAYAFVRQKRPQVCLADGQWNAVRQVRSADHRALEVMSCVHACTGRQKSYTRFLGYSAGLNLLERILADTHELYTEVSCALNKLMPAPVLSDFISGPLCLLLQKWTSVDLGVPNWHETTSQKRWDHI